VTDILFYHLTDTPLENALPPILSKSLERDWRVGVYGRHAERIEFLDRHLWSYADMSFLPHGTEGAGHPVLLSTERDAFEGRELLMLIDGADVPEEALSAHERVCVFFDGNDNAAVSKAREQWVRYSALPHDCAYWAQESGKWVKKK
jgi:DNA polymerase-3 subunit chi